MIKFLLDNDVDVAEGFKHRNLYEQKIAQLPFDQELKRMTVIRYHPTDENQVRIVCKGAPEEVLPLC